MDMKKTPPFKLRRIDHIVLRCKDFKGMFAFYTDILGCTIDRKEDIGRFGGSLSHLRAGDALIDLLSYDEQELTEDGKKASLRMYAGGDGSATKNNKAFSEIASSFDSSKSTLDHLCLRVDPFNKDEIVCFLKENDIEIFSEGLRYGSEGQGESIYIKDPEGNVVELKGPSTR
eukprot:CAMPEP_0178953564 /NCGR_PEP_ID=MMETSP0789-20121207/8489_1 /TAXON_ID=3005 /ORGANISM="Rhizosolenia setigera, Strain CCMP 1694" /LENGTH=172 /DNA_ID=CAMNT_0020634837 /DNA_START=487 /DNA_END=1005 /DNA_ORIENTATION=+